MFVFFSVTPEELDKIDEDATEAESEADEKLGEYDPNKPIIVKPVGGPLLAQVLV